MLRPKTASNEKKYSSARYLLAMSTPSKVCTFVIILDGRAINEYGGNESYGLSCRCEDNLTQESYRNLFIATSSDCTRTISHSTGDSHQYDMSLVVFELTVE